MKVFSRYISKHLLSFIGLILALVILNIAAFAFTFYNAVSKNFGSISPQAMLKQVAAASSSNGITNEAERMIIINSLWAMYLNMEGSCNWTVNLPEEIPTEYSIQDIAIFSKGYLKDYPVFVWSDVNGLLVIGYPKNSYMKITSNYYPIDTVRKIPLFFFLASLYSTCWFCSLPIHVPKHKSAKIQNQLFPPLPPCQKGKA